MNLYPLTILWLRILALIAVEIGLVAMCFALAQRWSRTAVWRKTLCQAALITSLVIAFSELSGTGRSLAALIFAPHRSPWNMFATSGGSGEEALANQTHLDPIFRSKVMSRLAENQKQGSDPKAEFPPAIEPISPVPGGASRISDPTVLLWMGIILGIGAAFVAGRACLGRLVLTFLGPRRRVSADSEMLSRVHLLAQNLKMSRRVTIVESARLVSPIAFGFFRPKIGLPLNFCGRFSSAKQEVMLTHELAHLTAHDPFWYLLADLVAAVFWWHPGIWWLRRQLQLSSELAADEASLMRADGPHLLAECLVEVGAQLAKPVPGQLRVAGFRSDLGCRVQRLMQLAGAQYSPISRARTMLARSIAPLALTVAVMLCTAWAVPRQLTKGDSMKTMKRNWQRVFATFGIIAAIQAPTVVVAQESAPGADPASAQGVGPGTPAAVAQNPPAAGTPRPPDANAFQPKRNEIEARYGLPSEGRDRILANRARYGLPPQSGGDGGQPENPPHGGRLEAKLKDIVLDEVKLDGLPLSEVLNFLSQESQKHDPEKKGINFLLNPNPPQTQPSLNTTIDPTTGLPIAGPTESIDISSVTVKFNIPLRHVTMADVLDAIVRVADHPIQYALEDYAVIFSLRADGNFIQSRTERPPWTRTAGCAHISRGH